MANITKAARELDKYKSRAASASKRARNAPMEACTTGLQVAPVAAAAYGAARTQVPLLDSQLAEFITGAGGALLGFWMGSPTMVQASTGILCVAAHNAAEDFMSPDDTPSEG